MKKEMIDLLKKKNKISNKNADDILEIEEEEIVEFLKEIGLQEGNITNLKNIKETLK